MAKMPRVKSQCSRVVAAPWVAAELQRCRRDLAGDGLNVSAEKAIRRAGRRPPWVVKRLTPTETAGILVRLGRTRALRATCLRRAVALWVLLSRAGHTPVLRMGVPRTDPRGEIHAWIELDGVAIGEADDINDQFLSFDLHDRFPAELVGPHGIGSTAEVRA